LSPIEAFKEALRQRIEGCFLCRWILEDLEAHGRITNAKDLRPDGEKALFPAKAKRVHLELEGLSIPPELQETTS